MLPQGRGLDRLLTASRDSCPRFDTPQTTLKVYGMFPNRLTHLIETHWDDIAAETIRAYETMKRCHTCRSSRILIY